MVIEPRLLEQARKAAEQIDTKQRELDDARAGFQRTIRTLYLDGASMREIADAVGLSHQRVHQLLDLPRSTDRGSRATMYCSYCGRGQHGVRKLIAGPDVKICDDCVELAKRTVAAGAPVSDSRTSLSPAPTATCAFCGKARAGSDETLALVMAPEELREDNPPLPGIDAAARRPRPPAAVICSECLALCDTILAEEKPAH